MNNTPVGFPLVCRASSYMVQIASLEGHTGNITGLAYSAQGKWIVTSSEDGSVKVWDTRQVCDGLL
jgi:WD40 repeat protein